MLRYAGVLLSYGQSVGTPQGTPRPVCLGPCGQMTFTEAMRNKARLSITGSVGENGRVLTPDCPKAVHSGPPIRQSSGLALVSSELP
ncbi:unnamed protein product [Arctogadus glacialis]